MTFRDATQDPQFNRRFRTAGRTPLGRYPIPSGSTLRAVECVHCGRPLGVTRWEYWNGFLVLCPHCGGHHGKPWGFQRTLVAGIFFNALSFFFTLRPRQALVTIVAFVMVCWALITLSIRNEDNDALMIASMLTLVLGPVLINAAALIRHQVNLDRAPPSEVGSREV